MSSVQRAFSQRNNNLTQIIPKLMGLNTINLGVGVIVPLDLSNVPLYLLTLPSVQNTGGVYYVDMSSVDSSNDLLNLGGMFNSSATIINFVVDVPFNAAYSPGLEFTIFFKNAPMNRLPTLNGRQLLTIGITNFKSIVPIPYMLSPPVPLRLDPSISQSITLKSDGTNYNVISSGPAGWMGPIPFAAFLSISVG